MRKKATSTIKRAIVTVWTMERKVKGAKIQVKLRKMGRVWGEKSADIKIPLLPSAVWRSCKRKCRSSFLFVVNVWSYYTYYSLLSATNCKSKWKIQSIQSQRQTHYQNWYDTDENLSNDALRKIIVENKFSTPINKNRIISYELDQSYLHTIYNCPFSITKNIKLMFQFKINHNILYTNYKFKKSKSNICRFKPAV